METAADITLRFGQLTAWWSFNGCKGFGGSQAGVGRLAKKRVGRPDVKNQSYVIVFPWHEKGAICKLEGSVFQKAFGVEVNKRP